MRKLINYIASCFCHHDWELIFETHVDGTDCGMGTYTCKTYRCKKCGYSQKYKSH